MEIVKKEPGLQGGGANRAFKVGVREGANAVEGELKQSLAALVAPHRADRCVVPVTLLGVAIELLQAPAGFMHENLLKRGRGVIVAGGVFSAFSRIGMACEQKRYRDGGESGGHGESGHR